MRVMVCVKATPESEAGIMPSQQLLADMGKFNEELVKAGVMLSGDGLHPTSKAKRVHFDGPKRTVTDGPFTETKEIVAGFWIWQVKSMEEAVEWVKRCPNPMISISDIDIRPIFGPEDFGDAMTPELRDKEAQLTAKLELKRKQQAGMGYTKNIFINLPIKDLKRSVAFFTKLGYTFNPQFSDEQSTSMIVGDNHYVMLLEEKRFTSFINKPLADTQQTTGSLVALSLDSREAVDKVIETALAAGARKHKEPQDYGFMYGRGFEDLDGHIWEYFWMNPAHVQ